MIRIAWVGAAVALLGAVGAAGVLVASSGGEDKVAQQIATSSPTSGIEQTVTRTPVVESPAPASPSRDCDPAPTAAPGSKLWRWGYLAVEVPESGVLVIGTSQQQEYDPPALRVSPDQDTDHGIVIDAFTGSVKTIEDDDQLAQNETSLHSVVPTIRICPFDASTARWPHTGEPPVQAFQTLGSIRYVEPDPTSGVQVQLGTACANGCRDFIAVRSARSLMYIDADSGLRMEPPLIIPEEEEAFDRYLSSVQVVGP